MAKHQKKHKDTSNDPIQGIPADDFKNVIESIPEPPKEVPIEGLGGGEIAEKMIGAFEKKEIVPDESAPQKLVDILNEQVKRGDIVWGDAAPTGDTSVMTDAYAANIQDIKVPDDLIRTPLNELGHLGPYTRYANFPVELHTEVDVPPSSAVEIFNPLLNISVDKPEGDFLGEPLNVPSMTAIYSGLGIPQKFTSAADPEEVPQQEDSAVVVYLPPPHTLITVKAVPGEPVKNNGAAFGGQANNPVKSSPGRNIHKARPDKDVKNV